MIHYFVSADVIISDNDFTDIEWQVFGLPNYSGLHNALRLRVDAGGGI